AVDADTAAALAQQTRDVKRVGVFVDPDDHLLARVLDRAPLDIIQLHGSETPDRVRAVRDRFNRPVMKAVAVSGADDLTRARIYENAADLLLFDAKPPKSMANALPGGNALRFDWTLLADARFGVPWFLSGGLDAAVIGDALRISGVRAVDVSSGVEDRPGHKSAEKITAFLKAVREYENRI
ncbi:MAG: phosphoribosylanthranilate isomerase, partial [Sphingomonadales bacterium]